MYTEKQRFRQIWLWVILIGILSLATFQWVQVSIETNQLINERFVPFLVLLLVSNLIYAIELKTQINERGVQVQFFPIHFKPRFYAWDSILKAEVRNYSPLAEYGGWGYRIGLFGAGKALNIQGNWGLQLVFKNGQKLLIGTQNLEKITEIMNQIKLNA